MVSPRCPGTWEGFTNTCACRDCQTREELRGECIFRGIEQANKLHNRGAAVGALAGAERYRDDVCNRWERWEMGEDLGRLR